MMNGKMIQIWLNDVMRFLDNVLTDFINKAPDQFKDAKYSAEEKEVLD